MDRAELYDDPRLLLSAWMYADGIAGACKKVSEMSDLEVKQRIKKYQEVKRNGRN